MITSSKNEYIKTLLKLKDNSYRQTYKKYLIEGEHLVLEALKQEELEEVICLDDFVVNFSKKVTVVSPNVMAKLSSLKTIPKVIGVCRFKEIAPLKDKILIADGVSDPGNMGTIIRTSVAFGIDTLILSLDSVDVYNEKVLRSAQGMHFGLNIIKTNLIDQINSLKEQGYDIFATVVKEGTDIRTIKSQKYALIIGNEGSGIRKEIIDLADKKVTIIMKDTCESLNVSIATAICLYELNHD